MALPLRTDNKIQTQEVTESIQILTGLAAEHFKGSNAAIMSKVLSGFDHENLDQFIESVISAFSQRVDITSLSYDNIEQLDIIDLAKEIGNSIQYKTDNIKLTEEEAHQFSEALDQYCHVALHDIAFPLIAAENPNAAVSVKNLLKRVLGSLYEKEKIDLSELYEKLDIENLPVQLSYETLLRLSENLAKLRRPEVVQPVQIETTESPILYCELTPEQAVCLSHMLMEDYSVYKNWKAFYHLLKSNGKQYKSVVVKSSKVGVLLSVIHALHKKKTLTGGKYLRMDYGNGFWQFFQEFLIESKTDLPFPRDLRRLHNETKCPSEAADIIDFVLNPTKHQLMLDKAKEIMKTEKL